MVEIKEGKNVIKISCCDQCPFCLNEWSDGGPVTRCLHKENWWGYVGSAITYEKIDKHCPFLKDA